MTLLLMPMSASASEEPIQITEDGQYVIMPVEVFRNREIDLIRLEAKGQALEKALAEERESMDAYLQRMKDLERVINEEQKAMELQAWKDKTKWGVLGLAIGVVIGIAAD